MCALCGHSYCVEKPNVHIARRLYGGQVPWRDDEEMAEDEITRQRFICTVYVHNLFTTKFLMYTVCHCFRLIFQYV